MIPIWFLSRNVDWNLWFNTFIEFRDRLYDFIIWVVDALLIGFWEVIDYCLVMAWDFCYYIYGLFLGEEGFVWYLVSEFNEFVFWLCGWFFSQFPELGEVVGQYSDAFSSSLQLVGMLNLFFPLTESTVLFGIYMGFMFVVLVVRVVLKLFPGLGG